MNDVAAPDAYGVLTAPTTLTIQRLLPGPIERLWKYLTVGELRRQWFAAGDMPTTIGAAFEMVWRNDELTDPPGTRPPGYGTGEHRMTSQITECEPPHKIAFTFGQAGHVSFELAARASGKVLLTVVHQRVPDRDTLTKVSAGWHSHLDVLVARLTGTTPAPFWDGMAALRQEYEKRLQA